MKLALGTAQFGNQYGITNQSGQPPQEQIEKILRLAQQENIDMLDTAIAYGNAEMALGNSQLRGFKVITKLPEVPKGTKDIPQWVHSQVQGSLDRLQVKKVYGLLVHHPQQLLSPSGELVKSALQALKHAGRIEKIGVSIYTPSELKTVGTNFEVELVQAPLSLVDRRLHTSGCLKSLHEKGVEVHVRSVFLQGLLLQPRQRAPEFFSRWEHLWDIWRSWCEGNPEISAAQACLSYVQSFSEVDKVVVGVETAQQLQELIEAARKPIDVCWPEISSTEQDLINPSRWDVE